MRYKIKLKLLLLTLSITSMLLATTNKKDIAIDIPGCTICLENEPPNHSLPCMHVFHKKCINQWFAQCRKRNDLSRRCPICRQPDQTNETPELEESIHSIEIIEERDQDSEDSEELDIHIQPVQVENDHVTAYIYDTEGWDRYHKIENRICCIYSLSLFAWLLGGVIIYAN